MNITKKSFNILIIKIGGSYVTEKVDKDGIAQLNNIHKFCQELSEYLKEHPNKKLIIAHGGGSFGHVPAMKYKVHEKFNSEGVIKTVMALQDLNTIIVNALLKVGIKAIPFHPMNFLICENKRIIDMYIKPLEIMIENNVIPIIHGDVAMDTIQGSCIVSADQIVPELAVRFNCKRVGFLCHSCVLDNNQNEIKEINTSNYESIKPFLKGSNGIDVTGGMAGKINELILAAKNYKIDSFVFNGENSGFLRFLNGEDEGTKICY